ncbi:unnamed protein product [Orchesella dallaii]|uniref:CUB domain-containing protein n=1 Tax=Orchesella dallaii TaxID=48710 RepID=A0ABP1QXK6_9HEXA
MKAPRLNKLSRAIITLILASLVHFSKSSQKVSLDDVQLELDQETRCGATIEADFGTLTVPSSGQSISPGSICIFTIHLQTTNIFQLNITSLDVTGDEIPGQDEDCSEAAVRIYSLTNLIPSDRVESYTFCNDNPPPPSGGNFYLSGSLATVIYQAGFNRNDSSGGFTLNFEGLAFQPIPTKHESTYSSAPSGFIRYPAEGEYEPSKITTWLVKTSSGTNPNIQLDVIIQRMDIETCEIRDDNCLCDALILYDVTSTGVLKEVDRLCGNIEDSLVFEGLGPNFMLAFFTDHVDNEGRGNGFDILYRQSAPTTTTPFPTSEVTEGPPPVANYSNECGGVLTGDQGLIQYKLDVNYNNYERCLWTIRTYYRAQIKFTLLESGVEERFDNIQINTLNSSGIQESHVFLSTENLPQTVILNGTVALILFQSDYDTNGKGFSLRYTAEEVWNTDIWNFEDKHRIVEEADGELIRFPSVGHYKNLELSTLTFIQPKYSRIDMIQMSLVSLELEVSAVDNTTCEDKLHVYEIREPTTNLPHVNHFFRAENNPENGICELSYSNGSSPSSTATGIVLILSTNRFNTFNGFEVELRSPVFPIESA